jgi:VanZ family protein
MTVAQRWWLAWGYTTLITAMLLVPMPSDPAPKVPGLDKLVHVALFLLLGWVWHLAARPKKVWFLALGFIYGLAIEILQQFTGRSFEYLDLVADSVGLVVARIGIDRWG